MSLEDPKRELAGIARATRLHLEREGASGSGDLLAQGAASARRRAPAGVVEVASARAGGPGGDGVSPSPSPVQPQVTYNLFGEPETIPAPGPEVNPLDLDLPPFHEPLNPAGIEPRAAIFDGSLTVLETVASEARACRKCGLCETRTQAVPGVGSARSGIVFVGEAPGADEDRLGEPFVGRAGELLTRIIKAMDDARLIPGVPLTRDTVYICNVLKCRPPENRNPLPHEIESCSPYLHRQLEALKPRIICCLGKFAAELLIGVKGTIANLRTQTYRFRGAKLVVTYHPAACLRNPGYKRPVWEDMQRLAREYLSE